MQYLSCSFSYPQIAADVDRKSTLIRMANWRKNNIPNEIPDTYNDFRDILYSRAYRALICIYGYGMAIPRLYSQWTQLKRTLHASVTSQDAFAERSLVDLPTVGLKLIFDFVDRLVGRNTVPQLYIL